MTIPRMLRDARAICAGIAAHYRARRTYRELCREGRAPRVRIRIELVRGDSDWAHIDRGVTGVSVPHVPLTRRGIRSIVNIVRDIRGTCLAQLRADERAVAQAFREVRQEDGRG